MIGCEYKYMDRYYVMVGETFQGVVTEPLFLETAADGTILSRRPERVDGWYLGVRTGRRWQIDPEPAPARRPSPACLLVALGVALLHTLVA
jgi:hypothetical protein